MDVPRKASKDDREILVVEDSPTQAERLKYILEQHGYKISVARNGREALAKISQRLPLVVISDIMMPEMDGYQLCRQIKGDDKLKEVPVILLTSLADPVDVVRGLECGADNFITKPYQETYLLSRIQYILINRELHKSEKMQMGIEIFFAGQRYFITSERQQILNLLLSTYETAVQKNQELIKAQEQLKNLNEHLEDKVQQRTVALVGEVTERRKAEERLRENLALVTALLDNLHIGVLFEDDSRCILSLNPKFCEMFGIDGQAQWNGRSCAEVVEAAKWLFTNPEAFVQSNDERFANDETVLAEELTMNDGRILERDHIPICVDEQRRGQLWLYRDVTERRRSEEALRQSEEQLRQSQKMEAIGRLAGGVAHDFNNLLTAIIGYSDVVLNGLAESDPSRLEISEIKKAGERAATLTSQLLAFSRKQVLQPRVLDLNVVVADMARVLQRLIGEDIELVTRPDPALARVKTDPGQIEQVILNLAVNARDAMPEGGKLTIETANVELDEAYARGHANAKPGLYVMLAVSDSGIGMSPETQSRIFEPFFTTKEKGKGTGLGLSTIYGIVKQSGGKVWVYSEPGQGATFKVYLPRVEEDVAPPERPAPAVAVKQGSETVLLVEDEEGVRTLVRAILQQNGYSVLEAQDGSEALEMSQQYDGPIHLMVTDVVMPQMNVRVLTQKMSQLRPHLKILYISGYTDDAIVHHGFLEDGMNFIQKPFTVVALARKVREVLDKS